MKKFTFQLIIMLLFTISVSAQQTQHHAHEHGIAELQIIFDHNKLEMIFLIPGADFIGFERSHLSEQEKELLQRKIDSVTAAPDLIFFQAGWFNKVIHVETEIHREEHHHEDSLHSDDKHSKNEHMHEVPLEEEHAEYELHFQYSSDNISKIKSAKFTEIFNQFPSLQEINWILVSESGQKAGVIKPDSDVIFFR